MQLCLSHIHVGYACSKVYSSCSVTGIAYKSKVIIVDQGK